MKRKQFVLGLIGSILVTAILLWGYAGITDSNPFAQSEGDVPDFLSGRTIAEKNSESDDVFWLYDRSTDETFSLTTKGLLPAAVACEMDLNCPQEALKAQAVACYTLFCRKRVYGELIACDPERWLTWTDESHLRERWGENYESCMAELRYVCEQVAGEVLTYDDEPILSAYTAITPGSTEDGSEVFGRSYPYLTAVASPGDCFADGYLTTVVMSESELAELAKTGGYSLSGESDEWLTELVYTNSGNVKTARLGGVLVSGQELRSVLGLKSAAITVERQSGSFVFTVRGSGHGVGLSQAGAVFLAKRSMGYEEILGYYYPGAEVEKG